MNRTLRVTFELSERETSELRHLVFAGMQAGNARLAREEELLDDALRYVRSARASSPLDGVRERLEQLETSVEMARDKDWPLPGTVRRRILFFLAFLVEPTGLVPDDTPIFGHLDEAVLGEILASDIRHELDAYLDFRRFRQATSQRLQARGASTQEIERRLVVRRKRLRARIQRRRFSDSGDPPRRVLGRFLARAQ